MKKLDVYLQEIKRQKISVDDLQHAAEILAATPQLPAELENPDLTREKREDLVRSLFPLAVRGIIEVLAQDQTMKMMPDLIKEAEAFEKPDKYLRCVLEYVKEPDEKQAAWNPEISLGEISGTGTPDCEGRKAGAWKWFYPPGRK